MTFKKAAEMWLSVYRLSLSELTIHKKECILKSHLNPYMGDSEIETIDDVFVGTYITMRLNDNVSKNTIAPEFMVIRQVMDYAIKKGLLSSNPCDMIKCPREPSRKFEIFTEDEINKLIQAARPKWLGDMILLAYRTGMRRGEVYGLQWADINFNQPSLQVNRAVSSYSPKTKFVKEPKTKSSNRLILIDNKTVDMLTRRYQTKTSDLWVFSNQYGNLMSPFYNVKYFRNACIKAGIPIRRFHDLRHTHITELLIAGVPPKVVQERAGHSSFAMTMDTYAHVMPTMQELVTKYLNSRS